MLQATIQLYQKAFSGLSKNIWLLAGIMLVNRCGTMVLAFMTLYCTSLGYTLQQGGIVVGIYGIGSAAGAYIGGRLTDVIGGYKVQYLSLMLGGVFFILLGQMHSYILICVFTFFLALINESFRPANSAAIAGYSTTQNLTQSYSLVRLAVNIGFGAGIAIGGLLASINYSLLFWVDGVTSITASVAILLFLPKPGRKKIEESENTVSETSLARSLTPAKDAIFLYFLLFQIMFSFCFFQLFTTIPVFFKDVLSMSEFSIGVVMALNGIIIALFEMILVYTMEGKKPYLVYMAYGSILMAASFLVFLLPAGWGIYVALISTLIITLAEMVAMPFMNSFYIGRTTTANRGRYAGMYTMSWSVSQILGSVLGTSLAIWMGYDGLWALITFICLLAGYGFYWLQKKLPQVV